MKLRKLELNDAPLMLEWMHDKFVSGELQADFATKMIEDCYAFIENSADMSKNMHLAIVDDNDTYMGTVSLKNIRNQTAEFAIVVRKEAMGKGYAKFAMTEMIRIGIEDLDLKVVYWYVNPENHRAIRFYEKNGYTKVKADNLKNFVGGGTTPSKPILIFGISKRENSTRKESTSGKAEHHNTVEYECLSTLEFNLGVINMSNKMHHCLRYCLRKHQINFLLLRKLVRV